MYLLDSQDFSNLYKNGDFSIDFPESFIIAVEVHPTKTKNTKYIIILCIITKSRHKFFRLLAFLPDLSMKYNLGFVLRVY